MFVSMVFDSGLLCLEVRFLGLGWWCKCLEDFIRSVVGLFLYDVCCIVCFTGARVDSLLCFSVALLQRLVGFKDYYHVFVSS